MILGLLQCKSQCDKIRKKVQTFNLELKVYKLAILLPLLILLNIQELLILQNEKYFPLLELTMRKLLRSIL